MPEFFNVLPPDEARSLLFEHIDFPRRTEKLSTVDALGRVTAEPAYSPHALPSFRRSTMDGYAVRAADTYGASETLPAILSVIGEVEMGKASQLAISKYAAAVVHTGGMIPGIADAVVQIEHTQQVDPAHSKAFPFEIEVYKAVAVGQNVLQVGEDVQQGVEILPGGHHLRAQDLGGLLALGITEITVARRPRVAIIATGDEVIEPGANPMPGQIRDINSYTVAGQTRNAGGIPVLFGIIPDDFAVLKAVAETAIQENEMVVMSAGSSVSVRDMTVRVMEQLGVPGVLFHGVATRPGKPTIIGVAAGKPLIGLPGNPVSAMVQYAMFGTPTIYRLQGLLRPPRQGIVWARISANIASESGREDYVPAKLEDSEEGLIAKPVFGKSNLIYTLVNADGLLKVPLNSGGLEAGDWVEVRLF